MNKKEKEILDTIRKLTDEFGYPPTFREIMPEVGISSTSTIASYMERMKRKGLLNYEKGKTRTLRIQVRPETQTDEKKVLA